jgi:HK97 family phage portal protein
MKLSFRDRLKVLATGTLADHQRAFLSGEDSQGDIDADAAMKYSAVNACIRVLSETFASVPLLLYQKEKNGKRKTITNDDIYDMLHSRPNEEMCAYTFWETVLANFCAGGNAVCERQYNAAGEFIGLYPYPHTAVEIKRDVLTDELIYEITGKNGMKRQLKRTEVFHMPNLSFDGVIGLSPLTYAASAVRLGLSYEQYGVNFYKKRRRSTLWNEKRWQANDPRGRNDVEADEYFTIRCPAC